MVYGCGIVYKLAPDGNESVLYAFGAHRQNGTDPGSLIQANGRFYGAANEGGKHGYGTVFRLGK
jgi:hypothetical protein